MVRMLINSFELILPERHNYTCNTGESDSAAAVMITADNPTDKRHADNSTAQPAH